jgi:hypothetical protein
MPIIAHIKIKSFGFYEKTTYFFKIGHLVIRLHSNTCIKDYNHSLKLVYTRGVFSYRVITSGGYVYPTYLATS